MKGIHFNKKEVAVLVFLFAFTGALWATGNAIKTQEVLHLESKEEIQEGIAKEVIRFHVLANSDSKADQTLKLQVKTEVIEYLKQVLGESNSLEETRKGIHENLDSIVKVAEKIIVQKGCHYPVTAKVKRIYFPEKTYGDCTFPAGEYEALQIRIGAAKGQNWWCVLYPSLCFIDAAHGVVTEEKKEELRQLLTEEEYREIIKNPKIKIRFRHPLLRQAQYDRIKRNL